MKTIAQIIKKCPELYKEHAIMINRTREVVKYVFKDFSSIEIEGKLARWEFNGNHQHICKRNVSCACSDSNDIVSS